MDLLLPSGLYRRLRIHTGSAISHEIVRGLESITLFTAGREFHPALKKYISRETL